MKRKFFGTDGVRGLYGGAVINEEFAFRLARAAARWCREPGPVLLARDTRASGHSLSQAAAAALQVEGMVPRLLGVLPTPALARAVRDSDAVMGVMISASHNPAEDNGIKFFSGQGMKLDDSDEIRIESLLDWEEETPFAAFEEHPEAGDIRRAYIDAAVELLGRDSLAGWRIVLDTANGATSVTSPFALKALGADLIQIGDSPDGRNINLRVGSEYPALLAGTVKARGARLGIAHDGDGDRCVLCDEQGLVLDGDEIMAIIALHALRTNSLPEKLLVATVQSNLGLDLAVTAAGGRVVRADVGDRYVLREMLARGGMLGGEQSGHLICGSWLMTGDGLAAALMVLRIMLATGKPLSELRREMRKLPQKTSSLKVLERKPLEACPVLRAAVETIEQRLGSRGRVLVRFSGTEARLRLLVEGPAAEIVDTEMAELEAAARREFGLL